MLSEFAPIPGTPDGEACRTYTNLDEPLNHNKAAFTFRFLGEERVNVLKSLSRQVNLMNAQIPILNSHPRERDALLSSDGN